jgi:general secretion pathway protein D
VKSVGKTFTVQVKIDNGSNVFAIPFDINYDPNILEVTGLREGAYLKKGGGQTTFLNSIDKARGKITVGLTRLGRIGGVSGSGNVMSINFKALRRGTASLSFTNGKPMDAGLNALPVEFTNERVIIQ